MVNPQRIKRRKKINEKRLRRETFEWKVPTLSNHAMERQMQRKVKERQLRRTLKYIKKSRTWKNNQKESVYKVTTNGIVAVVDVKTGTVMTVYKDRKPNARDTYKRTRKDIKKARNSDIDKTIIGIKEIEKERRRREHKKKEKRRQKRQREASSPAPPQRTAKKMPREEAMFSDILMTPERRHMRRAAKQYVSRVDAISPSAVPKQKKTSSPKIDQKEEEHMEKAAAKYIALSLSDSNPILRPPRCLTRFLRQISI
jgi:hypothetical protein